MEVLEKGGVFGGFEGFSGVLRGFEGVLRGFEGVLRLKNPSCHLGLEGFYNIIALYILFVQFIMRNASTHRSRKAKAYSKRH